MHMWPALFDKMLMGLIVQAIVLWCAAGSVAADNAWSNPMYRFPAKIKIIARDTITPVMAIKDLSADGDSSAASDRLAISDGVTVKVYSLKSREVLFSRSCSREDAGDPPGICSPSIPCRLSPDGRKLALMLKKAQKVEILDIDTGKSRHFAVASPSLMEWSDRGTWLLALGKSRLHLISPEGSADPQLFNLVPPGGIPSEYALDYEIASIHLMPDDRTLYFIARFTISSTLYSMDMTTGAVRMVYSAEGISLRFSSTSQYLCAMSWEHPGDGSLSAGTITTATFDSLKARDFVSASSGKPSSPFAALGPWCAFTNDMIKTPDSSTLCSSVELLFFPGSQVLRLPTSSADEVRALHFSWHRQYLIMDLNAGEGRSITVIDPRSILFR